jgi:hypothetical protein
MLLFVLTSQPSQPSRQPLYAAVNPVPLPTPLLHPNTHQVQGVFFRDCTVRQARALQLVGWVANSRRGTVMGVAEGAVDKLADMKVGSCS